MKRVIIIGNSPQILEKKIGDQIDLFDIVIRINDFKIKGFEEYIGRKTTHWMTSFSPVIDHRPISEFKAIYTANVNQTQENFLNRISRLVPNNLELVKILPEYELLLLKNKIGYFEKTKWPTSGIIAIHTALTNFPNYEIYIHGFSFFKESTQYVSHYWNEHKLEDFKKHHDHELEKKYVDSLIQSNLIRVL